MLGSRRWLALFVVVVLSFGCDGGASASKSRLRLQGSTTVNPVAAEAAEILRARKGWRITVDTQGGSSGGITAVGEGAVDIGMSSKPVSKEDRSRFSGKELVEHIVGFDAVAVVVSRAVWDGGVKALSKEQLAGIFTGKILNWKELGGPDAEIFVYNKEPGRGTLAIFEKYVFGGRRPKGVSLKNYAEVGANEETRQKVENHSAAISQLSASWADKRKGLRALGISLGGKIVRPSAKSIRDRSYPMVRGLELITIGQPSGPAAEFIDFVKGKEGQDIVRRLGYLPILDES